MNKPICPLLSAGSEYDFISCEGDRCAWFYGDHCAVMEIAMNTGDIQNVADMIDYHGGMGE
ncbi:hypothetical protein [Pseudoflavonifractor sp. HCP28S3_F10]|uniref:hypothetical protein n=1 Tax=Pseudoflavonifractor sp. HCP28S3_F10 TaxID=3438947 RepID=UPI003F889100